MKFLKLGLHLIFTIFSLPKIVSSRGRVVKALDSPPRGPWFSPGRRRFFALKQCELGWDVKSLNINWKFDFFSQNLQMWRGFWMRAFVSSAVRNWTVQINYAFNCLLKTNGPFKICIWKVCKITNMELFAKKKRQMWRGNLSFNENLFL